MATSSEISNTAAQGRIRTIVERIERLNEDKAAIMADIKEVFAEAKGEGFDVKILRRVISIRSKDAAKLDEEQALIDLYLEAIGSLPFDPVPQMPPKPKGMKSTRKSYIAP